MHGALEVTIMTNGCPYQQFHCIMGEKVLRDVRDRGECLDTQDRNFSPSSYESLQSYPKLDHVFVTLNSDQTTIILKH